MQAGSVVLCEPEVRRVTLPSQGARLIIASDGLWDAMNPKTAAHHVRGMQASKAAQELVNFTHTVLITSRCCNSSAWLPALAPFGGLFMGTMWQG